MRKALLPAPVGASRFLIPRGSIHVTANAPSTPAAVPIGPGDGGRCGGQNSSSSSSMNSMGSKASSPASSKESVPTLSAS